MILVTGATGFVGSALMGRHAYTVGMDSSWVFPTEAFTHVIHAATTRTGHDIVLTLDVLAWAKKRGVKVVYISSGAAGQPTDYGLTKRVCEQMCLAQGGSVLRLYSFMGPKLPAHLAPAQFATAEPVIVESPGTVRSYLYADQMADEILARIDDDGVSDIGGNEPVELWRVGAEFARQRRVEVYFGEGPKDTYLPRDGQLSRYSLEEMVAMSLGAA